MDQVVDTPIQRAAKAVGGAAELARISEVSVQAAYQWISGARPVPAERAPLIERASGVPCEELCPGVPWDIVRAAGQAASA
jgi:DNA-binding transcriptional regulator YdaS (Cro superfamily)